MVFLLMTRQQLFKRLAGVGEAVSITEAGLSGERSENQRGAVQ